jgi:hypothetical protein
MTKILLKVSLRYGVAAGVLAFVLLIVLYYLGQHPLLISPFLDFRVLLLGIFIFFALKEFRDHFQAGELHLWQGMLGGIIVIIVATTLSSGFMYLFGTLEGEFLNSYIVQITAYVKSFPKEDIDRIGKDIYERNLKALPTTNMSALAITYFMQGLVIGFFVNIVLSVSLRRQPKP